MIIQCCKSDSKYRVKYDTGLNKSDWLLCEIHYQDPVFQKNIVEITKIETEIEK